ncbi:hypothetical protein ABZ608_13820 [Streptomyces sp. NPDC013172]
MTFTNGDVNIPDAVLDVAAVPPVVADACAHGVARTPWKVRVEVK